MINFQIIHTISKSTYFKIIYSFPIAILVKAYHFNFYFFFHLSLTIRLKYLGMFVSLFIHFKTVSILPYDTNISFILDHQYL